MNPERRAPSPYRLLITIGAVAYATAYFLLDYNRFRTYDSGGDFGLYMQSVSDTSGLLRNALDGSHFAEHFSPIYDLAMPFVHFSNSVIPLMLFQVASGALVSLGLFQLGRSLLPEKLAFGVASIALFYPALAGVMFGDPYENVFATAVTVWLIWAVYTRKWVLAGVMVLAALAIKEDQAIFLIWGGVLLLAWSIRRNDIPLRRFSVGAIATSLCVLVAFVFFIRPEFAGGRDWMALQFALNPEHAQVGFDLIGRLGYLAEVLIPLALLPLLSGRIFLFAIPSLAEVILAPHSRVWTMGGHYAGVWIGYVLIAALFGVHNLYQTRPILAKRLVTISIVICIADLIFASPTHWKHHVHVQSAHDRALDELLATALPKDGSLGTHDQLYAHLWNWPNTERGLDLSPKYALIDTTMGQTALAAEMIDQIQQKTFGNYRILWRKSDVELYRRQ